MQSSIANLQEKSNKRFGRKKKNAPKLKVNAALAAQFLKAEDQTARDKILADFYRDIGRQMPGSLLHRCVVRLIEQYRAGHGEPPESMRAVYDYLHRKQIERVKSVREYHAMGGSDAAALTHLSDKNSLPKRKEKWQHNPAKTAKIGK